MNTTIQHLLGKSYSWDEELGELNYLGNPLSHDNQTAFELRQVALATEINCDLEWKSVTVACSILSECGV